MDEPQQLKEYTEGMSVLFVEDDVVSATIVRKLLELHFDRVYGATDGSEGLRRFLELQPDLIVTDLMMPVLDGIGMLREVRTSNQRVPVLLMTASLEHVHLVEAINLGVSKFLPKPIRADALERALLEVVRGLHLERVAEKARQQEVELLLYRTRYHSQQEEMAQAKERHIVTNHLQDSYLPGPAADGGWLVDLLQQPRDIMSGDSYAVIRTADDRMLLFLADAMGHGLSASVTSMLGTAFFNHVARGCACSHLGFTHLCTVTTRFAANNLLDDEAFSGLVLELDPQQQKLRFVGCGMPALLLVRNGRIERVRCANPPVSSCSPPPQMQELDLEGVSDILLATDGLGDAPLREGGSYRERLSEDLLETATATELFSRYFMSCDDSQNDDDITLIRLTAVGGAVAGHQLVCPGSLAGIEQLQQQVRQLLEQAGAGGEPLDNLELALTEGLLNAFEHGCLGMGTDKQRLLLEGEYDELIMATALPPRDQIRLTLTLVPRGRGLQVWVEIADPGPGFTTADQVGTAGADAPSGRGFLVMKRSVDLLRRNSGGNRLVLMQKFATLGRPH